MTAMGYTVTAAATELGVEESTIESAIRHGSLKAIALPGRHAFIPLGSLQTWLATMPDWVQSGSTAHSGSANLDLDESLASATTFAKGNPSA